MSSFAAISCVSFALLVLCSGARADERPGGPESVAERVAASKNADREIDSVEAITARKLFLEGRALLDKAQTEEACRVLERSHALNPTLAALLNLGLCFKALGRVVTAHDYYREAEVAATLQRDTKRREFAHDEAAALAPLRATLTLRIAGAAHATLKVLLDDDPQPRESWERPFFVDAGEHRIEVRSAGAASWVGTVVVVDGSKHVVVVPDLARAAQSVEAPALSPEAPSRTASEIAVTKPLAAAAVAQPAREGHSTLSTQRILAITTAAAGVGALTASLIFSLNASSRWNESNEKGCDRVSNYCGSTEGLQLRDAARADAIRATVLATAGGAALAGGIILWLLPIEPDEERPSLSVFTSTTAVAATWTGRL